MSPTNDEIKARLQQVTGTYAAATAQQSRDELPPDGTYQCIIDRFDWIEAGPNAKNPGELFLKCEMTVRHHPQCNGWQIGIIWPLENPDRLATTKKNLRILGVPDDQFADLPDILGDIVDSPVRVTVKTSAKTDSNGVPYRNVYLDERLGDPIRGDGTAPDFAPAMPGGGGDADEIPFAPSVI